MVWQNLDTVQRPSNGATLLTSWGDQVNDDTNFLFGDTSWQTPALINSWVNFGGFDPAGCRLFGNIVFLRGIVKSGAFPSVVMVLPVGYRPTATNQIPVASNGLYGQVHIDASGNVLANNGNNVAFSLYGVCFPVV